MKKFTDSTENLIEPALRVGSNIPSDSVNLGYYSGKEINSKDNLSYIDLSGTIPENVRSYDSFTKLMFPNELGILEDIEGNQLVEGSGISISNLQLSKETFDRSVESLNEVNENDYVHGYYVSRFFSMFPKYSYSLSSLEDFYEDKFLPNNIKVVDNEGKEYVDVNSGRKRYRILLEPFITSYNSIFNEIPYKIIVLLDTPNPTNINLIYDKIECLEDGRTFNQILRYSEKINAVRYFEDVPEESQIIDPSNYNAKKFSIKRTSATIPTITGKALRATGKQIFVNKKALDDNRRFENFNWRMIVEISNSVRYDDNSRFNEPIKAGVLYSSSNRSLSSINPYVFFQFEKSPYNINNWVFENPNSTTLANKNLAEYWLVDIDNADLSKYDILVYSCDIDLTVNQGNRLRTFASRDKGTLLIDASSRNGAALENLSPKFSISTSLAEAKNITYNTSNLFLDVEKNNCFNLDADEFPENYYGIFGVSVTPGSSTNNKKYYYFDSDLITEQNSILTIDNDNPIFVNIRFVNNDNPLTSGNIIATTTPILDYCNNVLSFGQASNSSEIILSEDFQNSQDIEGPFKFLANAISVALKDRALINSQNAPSTIYSNKSYFVSSYGGNWLMYSNSLLNSEKIYFQEIVSNDGEKKLSKDLTPLYSNIKEFFRYSFNSNIKLNDLTISKFFDEDESKLNFYIEYTNENVSFTNTESVLDNVKSNLNISDDSFVVKITNPNAKVFAYTDFESPRIYIPSGIGNNLIKDKALARVQKQFFDTQTKTTTNSAKRYPINLSTFVSLKSSAETLPDKIKVKVPFTYTNAKLTQTVKTTTPPREEITVPGITTKVNAQVIQTSEEYKGTVDVGQITNTYSYTYDIDEGNSSVQYKQGSAGMDKAYIKYIQYTLNESGTLQNKITVDGQFGAVTTNAVKLFQQAKKLRVSVNNGVGDGVVDSETKEALAEVWLSKTEADVTRLQFLIADTVVNNYIRAARKSRTMIAALNDNVLFGDNDYTRSTKVRMINFTNVKQNRDTERHVVYISLTIPEKTKVKDVDGNTVDADIDKIISLTINDTLYPVNFSQKQGDYQGIKINDFVITDDVDLLTYLSNRSKTSTKNKTAYSKTKHVLNINKSLKKISGKRILLEIEGSALGGSFGNAEGVAIDNIIWTVSTVEKTDEIAGITSTNNYSVKAKVNFDKTFTFYTLNEELQVSVESPKRYTIEDLEVVTSVDDKNRPLKTIYSQLNLDVKAGINKTITFNDGNSINLDTTLREHKQNPQYDMAEIDGTVQIFDAEDPSSSVNLSFFDIIMKDNNFSITVKSNLLNSKTAIRLAKPITNYRLKNKLNQILPKGLSTVSYLDGVLLLAKDSQSLGYGPEGFDDISKARVGISENIDVSVARITVINKIPDEYGFVYGFYDIKEDKFIGQSLQYSEYIARGPQNIYVAVYANDFDGNENEDFIGDLNSSKFPVSISRKIVTPIYSVYSSPSNKIQIKPSLSNLPKTEAWPIRITSGSFYKYINASNTNYATDVYHCKYDTSKIRSVAWSKLYGRGFYDVVAEKPEILSSRSIQLRQTPIHRVHEKSNIITNFGAIIKPVIKIFTRQNIDSPWEQIDYSTIRNIDCNSGLIEFNESVVPSFESLIKVDYTVVCEDLLIKTDGFGNPIPINPFLNKEDINLNKPLYIYIYPTEVFIDSRVAEQDYSSPLIASDSVIASNIKFDSIINFTYDNSIFNKNDSLNYNPFALLIGIIYTVNTKNDDNFAFTDLRSRGGGISSNFNTNKVLSDIEEAISYWDVYPPLAEAYPKGGYVIVKIPSSVKENFVNPEEVHRIVKGNMTAGVVFEIQDMDGNDWSSS